MERLKTNGRTLDAVWLIIGGAAYIFIGWRWNAPAAAWVAPVFLMRFFRNQENGFAPLLAVPVLYGAFFANMYGAWDLPISAQLYLPVVVILPVVVALYVDRAISPKLNGVLGTLVFPTVYVSIDYLLTLTPFGSLFSFASTQFAVKGFIQTVSVTGIWGVSFLIAWSASVVNQVWEKRGSIIGAKTSVAAFLAIMAVAVTYGSIRMSRFPVAVETVKVAGITVEHPRDYWSLLDINTPREEAAKYSNEFVDIENELFRKSEQAAENGAKIILWAEGNGVVLEEDIDRFNSRASAFSKEHGIYLAAGLLELRYDTNLNYNRVKMFTPEGVMAFDYQKTESWLPVDADGVIHTVETPYGTIAAAICFDMDFPGFIRQAAAKGTDIMLVPGYDSAKIRPFHTELALLRGIEGGYSVVRQVNEGSSMASDYRGIMIAHQDYFSTEDRTMYADVPIEGTTTAYTYIGDAVAWLSMAGLAVLIALSASQRKSAMPRNEDRQTDQYSVTA